MSTGVQPNGKHPSESLAPRDRRRHQPRSELKFGIRRGCRVTEISTEAKTQGERTSELSESRHCHRARILSSNYLVLSPRRSLSLSLSLTFSFSPRCLRPVLLSLPLVLLLRRVGANATLSTTRRACVSGRVSFPCSRRPRAGVATRSAADVARPHACPTSPADMSRNAARVV